MGPDVDAAAVRLGPENLRELAAVAWFCDCMPDGKYALIPSDRRSSRDGRKSSFGICRENGISHIHTEFKYYNGGEDTATGDWHPQGVLGMHQEEE